MYKKVAKIITEGIEFTDGSFIRSEHYQDCCEHHWLDFEHVELSDFDGLEFDLSNDNFFRRIPDYGIELIPVKGHSIKIPGYGSNNGYYGDNINLAYYDKEIVKRWDVSECQSWEAS
jgi:hypothetical protein